MTAAKTTPATATKLPRVYDQRPLLGCDPEFFFKTKDNAIVGAEKVLPKGGLQVSGGYHKVIIDGVQGELNPRPETCRAYLGNNIKACMVELDKTLKAQGKGLAMDFSQAVEITKENLMDLDEKARVFGCAPSLNAGNNAAKILDVDPLEYRIRAAGGHIHIGHESESVANLIKNGWNPPTNYKHRYQLYMALTTNAKSTVQMLDLICGNTAVLLDRDPANIERRKVYGRASEYRLPKHGLEYRTLSNFWLSSYQLMSMVFGMARLAVQLMSDYKNCDLFYNEFMGKVKIKDVEDAINNNDFDQAMANFLAIEPLILQVVSIDGSHPITPVSIKYFHYFVQTSKKEGLQKWFKQEPMQHWLTLPECHTGGCHDWLNSVVAAEYNKIEAEHRKAKQLISEGKLEVA